MYSSVHKIQSINNKKVLNQMLKRTHKEKKLQKTLNEMQTEIMS